jgi:hypothetical protein
MASRRQTFSSQRRRAAGGCEAVSAPSGFRRRFGAWITAAASQHGPRCAPPTRRSVRGSTRKTLPCSLTSLLQEELDDDAEGGRRIDHENEKLPCTTSAGATVVLLPVLRTASGRVARSVWLSPWVKYTHKGRSIYVREDRLRAQREVPKEGVHQSADLAMPGLSIRGEGWWGRRSRADGTSSR